MKSEEGIIANKRQRRGLCWWLTVAMLLLLLCSVVTVFSMGSGRVVANSSLFTLHSSLYSDSDTIVNTRWRIQPTVPLVVNDLDTSVLDLRRPDNIIQTVELDTMGNGYRIGMKIGDSYLNTPILMTPEEYMLWMERRTMNHYFRDRNAEAVRTQVKEKFSFADMNFDLGPAEKIFGPGGVRIRTQGNG